MGLPRDRNPGRRHALGTACSIACPSRTRRVGGHPTRRVVPSSCASCQGDLPGWQQLAEWRRVAGLDSCSLAGPGAGMTTRAEWRPGAGWGGGTLPAGGAGVLRGARAGVAVQALPAGVAAVVAPLDSCSLAGPGAGMTTGVGRRPWAEWSGSHAAGRCWCRCSARRTGWRGRSDPAGRDGGCGSAGFLLPGQSQT